MPDNTTPASSNTRPAKPVVRREDAHDRAGNDAPEPLLPHEEDQSADNQHTDTQENLRTGRQAKADIDRGLVDTDRAPVMDKLYREEFDPPGKEAPATKKRT